MDTSCDLCDDRLFHWHCRSCRHFLTQWCKVCPSCNAFDPCRQEKKPQ